MPAVSPDLNIPLVNALDVDISGRIDQYSDVGTTSNYKFAANWMVTDGLKVRANMSTSFVAPSLDIRGTATQSGFYVGGNTFTGVTNNIARSKRVLVSARDARGNCGLHGGVRNLQYLFVAGYPKSRR